jgi:hypothetical protein
MNKPYKVIWKFKNDNRYAQYHIYIFVGDLRPELDEILKKMQNLNLFDTFVQLTNQEIKLLENTYGDKWYKCFFNMYHTTFMISQIQSNETMSKELKEKLGQEWYDATIGIQKLEDKKILYSYSAVIKDEFTRKTVKKGRAMAISEDDGNIDYKISKNLDIQSLLSSKLIERSKPKKQIAKNLSQNGGTKKIHSKAKSKANTKSNTKSKSKSKANTKSKSKSKANSRLKETTIRPRRKKISINSRAVVSALDYRQDKNNDLDGLKLLSTTVDPSLDENIVDNAHDLDDSYNPNTESIVSEGNGSQYGLFYDWANDKYFKLNAIRFKAHHSIGIPDGERLRYDEIPDHHDIDKHLDEGRIALDRTDSNRIIISDSQDQLSIETTDQVIDLTNKIGGGADGDDDGDDGDDGDGDGDDGDDDDDTNYETEADDDNENNDGDDAEIDPEMDEKRKSKRKSSAKESDDDNEDFESGVDFDVLEDLKDDDDDEDADEDADADANGDTDAEKTEEDEMLALEKLYQRDDVEADDNISQTSDLIKKALNDDSLFAKADKNMIEFNQDKDASIHVEKLKNVFTKYYVKTQFIFGDDSIKSMKDKICCAIKNNKKFGSDVYLTPSRQYIWSEYVYNNNIEKVMIGQKWVRRNELLDIDIEPDTRFYLYEQLKDKLNILRHNIRKFGNKIRREEDENNILYDYANYVTDNELYMIDIYNELGKGYKGDMETLKNLEDVYMKLYFHKLRKEDIKNIVDYLNGQTKVEGSKIGTVYETINNDMIMENEIVNLVENVKKSEKYEHIFKENHVIHTVIHVNLRIANGSKLDMYRIFNEFQTDYMYPYIQYQTIERGGDYKYNEEEIYNYIKDKDNIEVLYKWFENAPYGISFKVRIGDSKTMNEKDKFISINLNETGRIEYKTLWQETDGATIDDVRKTYKYVESLIDKINKDSPKNKIIVPETEEFKFAFINTVQKFELPEKFIINHNDLSEFARFFYPYIALVIEPRKRQAKIPKADDKSKFGTYLRFKRVSKYDNPARLEQRIFFFLRNYEFQDNKIASELAKQFNITEDKALDEIQKAKAKYPNLKKSRKVLKKLDVVPKYKPPGIGIDIQGKQRDKYKIRISGARTKEQLYRIITFMNIFIYLYIETYLYKKKDRQIIKEKLKKLTNIAKRRAKVDELVDYSKETKSIKQMTQMDKRRIGFKPEKGQNQWTRSCQNSGNDKKRQPQQYNVTTLDLLIKRGYTYNKKTDVFEKKYILNKGKKKEEVVIKTIKLPEYDDNGENTGNYIHYSCDPDENGTHMFIGFLTRSSNPYGQCMPCCFKKDPSQSSNKAKKAFFDSCLGKEIEQVTDQSNQSKNVGDKLYILQDTNKIQEGRFGFLPKYLDRYFNFMLDKSKKIRHHYLEQTTNGYFFKYGSRQNEYQFLNAVAAALNMTIDTIKSAIISTLENDRTEQIFTSLNCGDIKTQFSTRENYINFFKTSLHLDYILTKDIISIPNVLTKNGLNLVVFHKREIHVKKTFEKDIIIEDFYLDCADPESHFTIKNPDYSSIFIIKDNKNYYPIVLVKKDDKNSKTIATEKSFNYEDTPHNIVNHVSDFFNRNCAGILSGSSANKNVNAKQATFILRNLGKDYTPKYQIVDIRNKCKYLITNKGVLMPVRQSGAPWDVQIIKNFDRYIIGFEETYKNLTDIYIKTKKRISTKPIGVYYESMTNKDSIKINSIMTKTKEVVPVIPEIISIEKITSMKLIYEKKPLTDKIDDEILKGPKNFKFDERIIKVNENMFIEESYQLFRLEFSNYINKNENLYYKTKFEKIIANSHITKSEKVDKIRLLLYKIIDKPLYDKYMELLNIRDDDPDPDDHHDDNQSGQKGGNRDNVNKYSKYHYAKILANIYNNDKYDPITNPYGSDNSDFQKGGKINRFIQKVGKLQNLSTYEVNNDRKICEIHTDRDKCNNNPHCRWAHNVCHLGLTADMIVMFVNRVSEELALNDMKAYEIMHVEGYFVSDIVDRNRFTYIPGQRIIRTTSSNIKKILHDLFGKDSIPAIGRRKISKISNDSYYDLNLNNPMIDMIDMFVQRIIPNNITIFRAYANGYYWAKNTLFDSESRNLGYYSLLQSDLANNFKSMVIDWLSDSNKQNKITPEMINGTGSRKFSTDPIKDYIIRIANDIVTTSNGITELLVLTKINNDLPIIIRNDVDKIIYIFDNGKYFENPPQNIITGYDMTKCINLRYDYSGTSTVPDVIEVIYYKNK